MSMTESEAKRFADAYHDCKLVADSIVDDETFQKADSGLVLGYMREILEALEEIQQYRAIGTVSEFRELKEKATAKRKCPNCNELLNPEYRFCPTCRRKVDWSEGKE